MKHQLVELLKKANDGATATSGMFKELIRQYQMASIGYLIFGIILMVIALAIFVFMLWGYIGKKDWVFVPHIPDEVTVVFTGLCFLGSFLLASGIIVIMSKIGPALAPSWYMVKSLIS